MKFLKYPFWIFYRIWFYILVALPIIILFPVLIIAISRASWYPFFYRIARIWAWTITIGMGFKPVISKEETPNPKKSYMFIGNHVSMMDVMLMLVAVKNPLVFVGKKELAKIPLFGFFYKRTCILVDRSSATSRKAVYLRAKKRLDKGLSICIFPEGKVPEKHIVLDNFKDGAFSLAINQKIPIVPLVFPDNKKRFSYTFFSGGPGILRIKMCAFILTKDLNSSNIKALSKKAYSVILNSLKLLDKS